MRRDYDFGQQLGRGSFGVVFKVRRKADGRTFVCKQLQLKSMSKKAREEANQEVTLLRKVSSGSRYIVQYVASFLEGECLHIVMEFCEHGDLSGFVKARAGQLVEEKVIWKFLIQIGLGLRWLHRNRILHRDIKTLNVFLTAADDARLGDLGVARVLSHNTNFADTFVGTPYYLSPELCEEKPYNELSDVWAFGCVVYEMCTLRHPFEAKNHAALLIKILRGQFAPVSEKYSSELRVLIDGCMRRNFLQRTKLAVMLESAAVQSWAERLGLALDDSPQAAAAEGAAKPAQEPAKPRPASSRPSVATPAAAAPGAAAPPGAAAGRPPLSREAAPKAQQRAPARRPAEEAAAAAPLRARDRRVGDRRAGGGLLRKPSRSEQGSPAHTLIAAPASRSAAQVVRSAPVRAVGRPVVPAAPPPRNAAYPPSTPTNGAPGGGLGRGRPVGGSEERRRAAREVADLPDVVVPTEKRPLGGRNVPSVHQLFQLDPEPTPPPSRPASSASTAGGPIAGAVGNSTATSAEAVLRQYAGLAATGESLTLLPDNMTCLPGQDAEEVQEELQEEEDHELELEREVTEEEQLREHALQELEEEEEMDEEARRRVDGERCEAFDGAQPGSLRSSLGRRSQELGGELTTHSAFGTRHQLDDSLGYTAGDTIASGYMASGELGLDTGVMVGWGVAEVPPEESAEVELMEEPAEESLEEPLEDPEESVADDENAPPSAKLDSNGLLCDAHWQPLPAQTEIFSPLLVEPSVRVSSGEASPVSAGGHVDGSRPPRSAGRSPTSGGRSPTDRAAAKVARLTSQISRLHADVVRDLDGPGRAVWDQLYRLFQEKMAVDLTDEDQSEIERYVFEQLPTESTDLIWKVYKVLHLEQERDRCQRLLTA